MARPREDWHHSALRIRFLNAGIRQPATLLLYFSAKSGLALLLPVGLAGLLAFHPGSGVLQGALLIVTSTTGYYLPNAWLSLRIRQRQRSIARALPDLLDLLVLCVEAGLSLEQAVARVGREFIEHAPALTQELHVVSMELAAGSGRTRALRHLAQRVGLESVEGLVSLLIQAERFGTRVSDALSVQAEHLRQQRRRAVEHAAATLGVKLLFPLVFCIFPGLLVVLVGPAFIGIYRALGT
ncbi:MAG: type II secretion system F family protein [Burkholderiales bacterium]